MIAYEAQLSDRVRGLIEDVGPLGTVSLLGFVESDKRKADAALQRLAKIREWCFLDLRAAPVETSKRVLEENLKAPLMVVATRHDFVALPILKLVRAMVDKEPRVELGDYVAHERPRGQSMVLVVDGAAAHESLPSELKRVPYEEYLP